jgi:hypothetical protein
MSDVEEPAEGQPHEQKLELVVRDDLAGGVWANLVLSNQSPHELTLDFCRLDPHVKNRT